MHTCEYVVNLNPPSQSQTESKELRNFSFYAERKILVLKECHERLPFKTWCLHYPQCNVTASDITAAIQFYHILFT